MFIQEEGGINWTWFKVQNENLVAVFRLHYGGDAVSSFRKLVGELSMTSIDDIGVSWRDKEVVVANHTLHREGYILPEVVEKFGWLDDMFKSVADSFELESCQERMRHLEYHGVSILRP